MGDIGMWRTVMATIALTGLAGARSASADVTLENRGQVAFLHSSLFQPGDDDRFEQFLTQPRPAPIRIVYLDSRGGNTRVAIAIGRSIRQHGLATAFDVGRARCVSACTTVFLGGAERYYIGGDGVRDGVATHLGLGFHPNNGGSVGESEIADYYRDMGVTGALQLRYRIYSQDEVARPTPRNLYKMFFVGGRSALAAGVATSTNRPADSRLRD